MSPFAGGIFIHDAVRTQQYIVRGVQDVAERSNRCTEMKQKLYI